MDIVLVHPIYKPAKRLVAFYDGHVVAQDGVVRIPYDGERSVRWAKNAFLNGYRSSPDGQIYSSWQQVEEEINRQRSAEWETGQGKIGPATAQSQEDLNTNGAAVTPEPKSITKKTKSA